MSEEIKFKCSSCGKTHDEWPALTFVAPDHYSWLTDDDKKNIGYLDSDFCTINDNGEIQRFIRCTLSQKINDHCEDLNYGLWVSLSEKSYLDYEKNFKKESEQEGYFGWLCNNIIDYEFSESIPMNVYIRNNGQRPELIPHENFNHPFVRDFYEGISKEEAEKRILNMLNAVNANLNTAKKKWWKIWK